MLLNFIINIYNLDNFTIEVYSEFIYIMSFSNIFCWSATMSFLSAGMDQPNNGGRMSLNT